MQTPEQILKQYWGYDGFRPLQEDIIVSVMGGNDTLVLLPTGGGKSVCYQLPALMKAGFCLVISPLIALMQDQVARLQTLDIPAACIHSGMNFHEVKQTLDNALHDKYKILYVSPERLQTRQFNDYLPNFAINLIAVDEAHCISQWGHDFRPDYLKIAELRYAHPKTPILALTATATPDVAQDIVTQLKFRDYQVFQQSFSRTNIFYEVRYTENKPTETLRDVNRDCSIIYCRSRKQTESICRYLQQNQLPATAYHAGMSKDKRTTAQEEWMSDTAPIMAATTAFGMGIDKADVRMVLHYDAPEHLEAYYQEAGRAGRDGKPSFALALYNSMDIKRLTESTVLHYPNEEYMRQVYQSVAEYLQIPAGNEPHTYYPFELHDFCKKFDLIPAQAIHALKLLEREGLWTMTEAVYNPATVRFTTDRSVLDDLHRVNSDLAYVTTGLLRMYSAIFHYPTPIREATVAKNLKMKKDELVRMLEQLHKMELIEYTQPGEGAQMFFHHRRVDSRHLYINMNRIAMLKKKHEERTEAMLNFLQNTTICREKIILQYFGEASTADCGHCDVCQKQQYRNVNIKMLKAELLQHVCEQGALTLKELFAPYPLAMKETIKTTLRALMDEGMIVWQNSKVMLNS